MPAIIEIQSLSKLYGFGEATTIALDEVSLTIERGQFMAVMGPSGCGKSTLMHIVGLLDRPTHGSYALSGKSVDKLKPNKRAKARLDSIGFIFQSFNLLPRLNVIENVALPLAYKGVAQTKRLKIASGLLERVGLSDREYYLPYQLSGGQIQRVAIARALVNNPSIIIADEPTGNLDSVASRLVMELLSEIHAAGNTILLVTHNPELTRYAERVLYMRDGMIVHDEATKIGEIAKTARRSLLFAARTTEDDDIAGVSALLGVAKDKDSMMHRSPLKSLRKRRTKALAKPKKRNAK